MYQKFLGISPFVSIFMICVFLSGCVTQSYYATKEITRTDKPLRILLLNPDITLFEQTAGGALVAQDQWTQSATAHIKSQLQAIFSEREVNLVLADDFDSVLSNDPEEIELLKLHGAVGKTIQTNYFTPQFQLPTKVKNSVWSLGPNVQYLKEKYDADYAVFAYIHDSYASAGRVAAIIIVGVLFGVGLPGGTQNGFASMVDLSTGDVVWFNRLLRGTGDLREAEPARETVEVLLSNFPINETSDKPLLN